MALDQRLRSHVPTGAEFVRKRQILVFERFLARVLAVLGDQVVLKGGLALELRLGRARTTKDVDLRLMGSSQDLLERLREAGRLELGDFMAFEVAPDAHHTEIQSEGRPYDGLRFRAACTIAGKLFGREFGVDVSFGDPLLGEPDVKPAEDFLAFAGVAPPVLRIYPIETHIAEKLHAYTQPRKRPNSRVKDLPDLALLATAQPISAGRLRAAFEQSFAFRGTHALPNSLPHPSDSWRAPYAAMARADELPWTQLEEVTKAVQAFVDPVLARSVELDSVWDPNSWAWRR